MLTQDDQTLSTFKPSPRLALHLGVVVACCWVGGCGRVGFSLLPQENGSGLGSNGQTDGGLGPDGAPLSCDEDSDSDGTPDCEDGCPYDPATLKPGLCGCMVSEVDADHDGVPDCSRAQACSAANLAKYTPDATCGVGYCRTTNTPSSCVSGSEVACKAGTPLSASDTTADGIDDDCDGQIDEDACVAHTETYGAGTHALSQGSCSKVTVKLWGGGGASGSGQGGYWINVTGGAGGPGGYAERVVTVTAASALELDVGQGGQACGAAGTNANAAYNGGAGADGKTKSQAGTAGADGTVAGGNGGNPSSGGKGGAGFFGGGGGGSGASIYAPYGGGGGGGAATVLLVDGAHSTVAGGGGGGGGAGSDLTSAGYSGGGGGSGCSSAGLSAFVNGGGGGGGGVCQGATTQKGTGRNPYNAASLSAGAALGGNTTKDCEPGGNGYAIVSYGP